MNILRNLRSILLGIILIATPSLAEAAVSCSLLTQGQNITNDNGVAGYATASISPSANALVLAVFSYERNSTDIATIDPFSASGNGLTYVQVARQNYSAAGAPNGALVLFRAMGASPSAGAVTFTWEAGFNSNNGAWIIAECTGVDTSGTNGSGAVVQSDANLQEPGTGLTLSLAAFGSASNATFATFAIQNAAAITNEGGWTELAEEQVTEAGNNQTVQAQWINANDTSPSASWASIDAAGIAIEIKAAISGRRAVSPLVLP